MKVLIVEDSLLAGYAIKSYFEKLGENEVFLAKTGESGKEMFEKITPDLITVDAIMPGVSGFELIQFLNEHDKKKKDKKTKIIMISSDEIPNNERKQIKVDKYLLKPITFAKLKAAVDTLF